MNSKLQTFKIHNGNNDKIVIGENYFRQGKILEAIRCFEEVLLSDPSNIDALNNLGVIAFQLNNIDSAEQFLIKALRLDRRNLDGLVNLSDVYISKGMNEKAQEILKRAIKIEIVSEYLSNKIKKLNNLKRSSPLEHKQSKILGSKKILVINNLFPPQEMGGYGRVMGDYTDLLHQRGHIIHILTSDTRYLGEPEKSEPHIQRMLHLFGEWNQNGMIEYSRDKIIATIKENHIVINKTLNEFQPDICLVGNIDLLSVLIFSPIFDHQIPAIHRLGNEFIGYTVSDAPKNPLYHVITPSRWLKHDAIKRGYPFQNAFVIYSGAFVQEFEMILPPLTDKLRIIYASLVNAYKGPQVLIEALSLLNKKGIDFSCSIAGGSFNEEFTDQLKTRVKEIGLTDKIRFKGFLDRENLKNLYACHNVLVFPSLVNETFGISQVEGMAAGLAVITSGSGGAKEVIEDGVSGLYFKPKDYTQLAQHLIDLNNNRNNWESIALKGQNYAMEKFDIEQSVDKLESVFADILEKTVGL